MSYATNGRTAGRSTRGITGTSVDLARPEGLARMIEFVVALVAWIVILGIGIRIGQWLIVRALSAAFEHEAMALDDGPAAAPEPATPAAPATPATPIGDD